MSYQSLNPATGKVLKSFVEISDAELEQKLATASACYQVWRHKSYAERAVIVAKAAHLMRSKVDEFAHAMTLEMGKRIARPAAKSNSARRSWPTTPGMRKNSWRR